MSSLMITDDTTLDDLEEALVNLAQYAGRQMHHPDCIKWLRAHERIDEMLDAWRERG